MIFKMGNTTISKTPTEKPQALENQSTPKSSKQKQLNSNRSAVNLDKEYFAKTEYKMFAMQIASKIRDAPMYQPLLFICQFLIN